MYPHHVFDLEPAGTFGMYPICYRRVSGRYFQPEPAMYLRCFHWFPGPLAPSVWPMKMSLIVFRLRSIISLLRTLTQQAMTLQGNFIPLSPYLARLFQLLTQLTMVPISSSHLRLVTTFEIVFKHSTFGLPHFSFSSDTS